MKVTKRNDEFARCVNERYMPDDAPYEDENMEHSIQIKSTFDYAKFIILDANRDTAHKHKIIKSIQKIGLVPAPIVCNENMQVIDGQGRLSACEELGLPVYYIIVPGLGIEHCVSMNISQTNWSIMDYVKSYAAQGNQNYCRLLRLMERHPALSYKIIVSSATNSIQGPDNDTMKGGNLRIDPSMVQNADKLCYWIDENFVHLRNKIKGRFEYLCFALIFSYEHSGANVARLTDAIKDYAYDFSPIATTKDALAQIERFYNKNLKTNKIYFVTEYDKYLTENSTIYRNRWVNGIKKDGKSNNS